MKRLKVAFDALVHRPVGLGIVVAVVFLCIYYPGFLTLNSSPMINSGANLRDPVVSHLEFIPALRIVRYEVLHHFNFLWSSLMGFGMPLLAGQLQAAPAFPLTLLLIWLPDPIFWNVLIVSRLILIAVGCVLIGRDMLGMKKLGAIVFTLSFGFSVFVLRWMNHPWQNGFLAVVWYIYFLWKLFSVSETRTFRQRVGHLLGTAISAYSVTACGFPESSAMAATLTALVMPVPLIALIRSKKLKAKTLALDLGVSHFVAFSLAAPQILQLVEYVYQVLHNYRKDIGVQQYSTFKIPFFMIARVTSDFPGWPTHTYFGVIPTFLFFLGLGMLIKKLRRVSSLDLACGICLAYFILKGFPVWPGFNRFIGKLPVLDQSWFTLYFLPVFLWPVACFAGWGADFLFSTIQLPHSEGRRQQVRLIAAAAGFTVFLLIALPFSVEQIIRYRAARTLLVALLFFIPLAWAVRAPRKGWSLAGFILFSSLSLGLELRWNSPVDFGKVDSPEYAAHFGNGNEADAVERLVQENHLSLTELREHPTAGNYLAAGLATVDTGAPAILPARLQLLRTTFFQSGWGGFLPIEGVQTPIAWKLVSANVTTEGSRLKYDSEALGRAYMASRCYALKDQDASADFVVHNPVFKLGEVVLEQASKVESAYCLSKQTTARTDARSVPIEEDRGGTVKLSRASGPGILVLNDTYYAGWRAFDRVSSKYLEIRPANLSFRGIFLEEPREYDIEFRYEPAWLGFSRLFCFGGCAGLMAMLALCLVPLAGFKTRGSLPS